MIKTGETLLHWNYFLALESDLERVSRYIEFDKANFKTYSIELAHLLLAASSEVDVVAKTLCQRIDSKTKLENIDDYKKIIKNISGLILRNQLPPKSWIVISFNDPPDIFGAVFGFVYEVPARFKECAGGLHFGGGFTSPSVTG